MSEQRRPAGAKEHAIVIGTRGNTKSERDISPLIDALLANDTPAVEDIIRGRIVIVILESMDKPPGALRDLYAWYRRHDMNELKFNEWLYRPALRRTRMK